MKFFILFVNFLSLTIYSQSNNRFIYEYRIVKNANKKNDISKRIMYLDVSKSSSVFYDNENYKNDSILAVSNEISSVKSDKVLKKYPEFSVILITALSDYIYDVNDDRKLNWKITNEKTKILNYNAQKAQLDFAGRKWIAWFTTEIPIPDGPYKFHGLPGLIVKVDDVANSHSFELIGIKSDYYERKFTHVNAISVDYKKYKDLYKEYRQNPTKNKMGIEITTTQDGISGNEFKRKMAQYYKNQLIKDNNILEIDLLK
ncbi:GLPGLI family protein [Chryseobacterium ginsenosidimutans]|uniref:GLPGLI family protein n=1 Tax=Chryseobacterium ginsenosidimutans TaxID=687846 RepID=UPI00277E4BCE|nr:GLPGLI family protein [Chryseobacterium ginsenosidimutans]MDQ0592003.1 GLPGLI family protein [Chryseobacterium ginsenosidimutans]